MSEPTSEPSKTKPFARVLSLQQLSLNAFVREWSASKSLVGLDGQPLATELMKKVWTALKNTYAQRNPPETLRCVDMYPFVRTALLIENLDLSDSGKWINDSSLAALRFVPTLRNVRLTACRFISDEGLSFVPHLQQLHTLDVSWTPVGDSCVASYLARCPTLTSLNFTGNGTLTDRGVASLLPLTGLQRLALCATAITDQSLDYLTYYTRYPDPQRGVHGLDQLRWLELSNTNLTDVGVGKLVAIMDADGNPYGKVFKQLEYLGLSMTAGVNPVAVRQVQMKYNFDKPLPNQQRTLAKDNTAALAAQSWVIRFNPTKDRNLPAVSRSFEEGRVYAYVAQYTKEMAEAAPIIAQLEAGYTPAATKLPDAAQPDAKRFKAA